MRKRFSVLLLSVAVVSAPTDSTTLRIRGTIQKYDAPTRTLSLSTPNGTAQFPLASTVRVHLGWRAIAASDLGKLCGYGANVRYSESGGHKTVESVHVFGKTERTEP